MWQTKHFAVFLHMKIIKLVIDYKIFIASFNVTVNNKTNMLNYFIVTKKRIQLHLHIMCTQIL